ncbi:zinc dependent phospholipase C family protein [Hymenobacter latericus]|uniref:zinc dependent phospholipase C family protein n=1 Tax=Hymenobacter sp. YIM 151858-1 TaxID=2987688 RepID=UPI0022278391|nr:zinc dependent phospholipase C family protein [Hymenobacter sp. YIM 151858-1]UYZ61057.1 zinc dependent phospholipase C family protein [Hymenobacter sp. YIM 151858-1]
MRILFGACLLLGWLAALPAHGYSVLTHMANIDSTWRRCLVPTIERRFPGATPDELREAKAHAYGGAIIQDMGFYPFGSKLFTNLTHYVRSGDFVRALLDSARTRDEYAFALGALAHYVSDIHGHPEGTNRAMASVYPELAAQYGPTITYEEAPKQHTQLEFAFDVVQVAAGRYRSDDYHQAIGFKVSKEVLERAFLATYGLKLGQTIANVDLSIASYRFSISQLIPTATRAAWHSQRDEIRKLSPNARRRDYVYRYNERQYRREFGGAYQRPGLGARLLSGVVRVIPKIGPLRPFAFTLPTPEAQRFFRQSFRTVLQQYCTAVEQQQAQPPHRLINTDFDTGKPTRAGEYSLTDETYGEWVRRLADDKFAAVTPAVQQNVLRFFDNPLRPITSEEERKAKTQAQTQEALQQLRSWKR